MKLIIDERIKHRLTGLVVLLAVATIFVPALMKKSNQRFEGNINFSVKLPPKPPAPRVVAKDNNALFKTVKIAKVENLPKSAFSPAKQIAKAEPIKNKIEPVKSIISKVPALVKPTIIAKASPQPQTKAQTPTKDQTLTPTKAQTVKSIIRATKEQFSVQIASFTQQSNAETLVNRLRNKGYQAHYVKFNGRQGEFYKVMVGKLVEKNEAILLQKKLAAQMQINGFVVKAG